MYRMTNIKSKSMHFREKCLILMVLVTLCFLCFAGIFLLPDNFGGERVLRVYKQFQKAGPDIFIPPPPLANNAHVHGIDDDPHGDREKLQAKIREELGEIIEKPQVQRSEQESNHKENSENVDNMQNYEQGAVPPLNKNNANEGGERNDADAGLDNNVNLPVGNVNVQFPVGGNDDPDPNVQEKRKRVKEASFKIRTKK